MLRKKMKSTYKHTNIIARDWRALAKFHMVRANYPVPVIHNYELDRDEARELAAVAQKLDPEGKIPGIARARGRMLPFAAVLMKRVIAAAPALSRPCLWARCSSWT